MKRIFTPSKKQSILIVDDDPFATQIYREKLEAQGFKVEVTRDFDSTLQTLKKEVFDLLILDLCLPGFNENGRIYSYPRKTLMAFAVPVPIS